MTHDPTMRRESRATHDPTMRRESRATHDLTTTKVSGATHNPTTTKVYQLDHKWLQEGMRTTEIIEERKTRHLHLQWMYTGSISLAAAHVGTCVRLL